MVGLRFPRSGHAPPYWQYAWRTYPASGRFPGTKLPETADRLDGRARGTPTISRPSARQITVRSREDHSRITEAMLLPPGKDGLSFKASSRGRRLGSMELFVNKPSCRVRVALQMKMGFKMKKIALKRTVTIDEKVTSVSMEDAFWLELKKIAGEYGITVSQLIADVKSRYSASNLSSALRQFVLESVRKR